MDVEAEEWPAVELHNRVSLVCLASHKPPAFLQQPLFLSDGTRLAPSIASTDRACDHDTDHARKYQYHGMWFWYDSSFYNLQSIEGRAAGGGVGREREARAGQA